MPSKSRANASTPPLPSGTLTFLLTDIEGSTRLWQVAPDAMQIENPRIARGGQVTIADE